MQFTHTRTHTHTHTHARTRTHAHAHRHTYTHTHTPTPTPTHTHTHTHTPVDQLCRRNRWVFSADLNKGAKSESRILLESYFKERVYVDHRFWCALEKVQCSTVSRGVELARRCMHASLILINEQGKLFLYTVTPDINRLFLKILQVDYTKQSKIPSNRPYHIRKT